MSSLEDKVYEELLHLKAARINLSEFSTYVYPWYKRAKHQDFLDEKLMAVERYITSGGKDGIGRLIVTFPPRHGKSEKTSTIFPAWFLGRNPDMRVIISSYGASLAESFSRKVRNLIESHEFQKVFGKMAAKDSIPDPVDIDREGRSAQNWSLANHRGGLVAAGVGGPVTGFGANCVVKGTMVTTNNGDVPIENIDPDSKSCKILSFNEKKKEFCWQKVQAIKGRPESRIYRITSASGRVVEATGDHRFYSGERGYVNADALTPGDPLLLSVPEGFCPYGIRVQEVGKEESQGDILFQNVYWDGSEAQMHHMSGCCCQKDKTLLRDLSSNPPTKTPCDKKSNDRTLLSSMQQYIRKICLSAGKKGELLLKGLRQPRTLLKDVKQGKPQVEAWGDPTQTAATLREGFPQNATTYFRKGWLCLCAMLNWRSSFRGTPSGQQSNEQCCLQSGDFVLPVSPTVARGMGFQAEEDFVASIEIIRHETTVYDIQVSGIHNFFANDILVHNCLIIDDPCKDREEADSEVMREKVWDWFTSTAYTRLQSKGAVIIILTRWHEEDLAGRLMDRQPDTWQVVNLPAIAEDNDQLKRVPGESLWPEEFPLEEMLDRKNTLPSRDWNALYQQRPSAAEGNVFKQEWLRYGPLPEKNDISYGVQMWDTALTEKEENDPSVCVTVYVTRDGAFVADVFKAHLDFPKLKQAMFEQYNHWNQFFRIARIGIENRVSGTSVLQALKKESHLPIIPMEPISKLGKSKLQRAYSVSGYVQSGRVTFRKGAPWLSDLEHELLSFPRGKHDDQVDALTYALINIQGGGKPPRKSLYNDVPIIGQKTSRLEALAGGYNMW